MMPSQHLVAATWQSRRAGCRRRCRAAASECRAAAAVKTSRTVTGAQCSVPEGPVVDHGRLSETATMRREFKSGAQALHLSVSVCSRRLPTRAHTRDAADEMCCPAGQEPYAHRQMPAEDGEPEPFRVSPFGSPSSPRSCTELVPSKSVQPLSTIVRTAYRRYELQEELAFHVSTEVEGEAIGARLPWRLDPGGQVQEVLPTGRAAADRRTGPRGEGAARLDDVRRGREAARHCRLPMLLRR